MGRVAEVEPFGPLAVHLAHQQVADSRAVQRQRVGRLRNQSDFSRAPIEGDGGRGERPEHVDNHSGADGLPGVAHQAAHPYIHQEPFIHRLFTAEFAETK